MVAGDALHEEARPAVPHGQVVSLCGWSLGSHLSA